MPNKTAHKPKKFIRKSPVKIIVSKVKKVTSPKSKKTVSESAKPFEKIDTEKKVEPENISTEVQEIAINEPHEVSKPPEKLSETTPADIEIEDLNTEETESNSYTVKDIFVTQLEDPVSGPVNRKLFAVGGLLAGILVCTSVLLFLLKNQETNKNQVENIIKKAGVLTPTPTVRIFTRAEITFEVLNGSGVRGAAANAAKKLTNMGYKVVGTGNSSGIVKTTILNLNTDGEYFDTLILADMKNEFGVASSSGSPTGTTASAQLILGLK
jgi:hypothetical protein